MEKTFIEGQIYLVPNSVKTWAEVRETVSPLEAEAILALNKHLRDSDLMVKIRVVSEYGDSFQERIPGKETPIRKDFDNDIEFRRAGLRTRFPQYIKVATKLKKMVETVPSYWEYEGNLFKLIPAQFGWEYRIAAFEIVLKRSLEYYKNYKAG